MYFNKKIVVVLPAYKAEKTLERTFADIPHDIVDEILLVDDCSSDRTVEVARALGVKVFIHKENLGYGANQKTCYTEALRLGADIVVMLHPDYQYDPKLIGAMAGMIGSGIYDVVIASRILGGGALKGGMPVYKYVFNRFLTATQNLLTGAKLSEYHSGYRAFSRRALETLPLRTNSDDFVFDNQMLVQAIAAGLPIGEISCPTKYFPEASSINFSRSLVYGFGVIGSSFLYSLWHYGLYRSQLFSRSPTFRLSSNYYNPDSVRENREPITVP
ncbi:MAG TPA: glycosyltransferase family 2 protein [Gemmataceae bacterium]|nr:glycosyltransferase family 2 protein [Gemmataceae bacterium]